MPRVDLPHTSISRTGVAPGAEVTGDATNNHTTVNDGRVFVLVRNASGASVRTVTALLTRTVDGQAVASRTYAIPISSSLYVGPFPPDDYGNPLSLNVEHADLKLTAYHFGS